ncbi:family 16 glycoside hydrolase [Roseibacillus ishigakijimensis]|uniref:DUF1080 domain-containing protein n=1 Tax=Roseibacillus ishigakijimensis TaxID=454146 RepID=A0A934RNU9_9BACT|nr:family 16 glycoside hydrolase [Roseibacillus ishigakijimensis]MBK1834809.1 DUF1080 domain-containing protein [Roseibacillus ishigakijimensis]
MSLHRTLLAALLIFVGPTSLSGEDLTEGLTFRLYDIREEMDQLYPLVPGQTPNVDEKRDTIDWSGSGDFADFSTEFIVTATARLSIPTSGSYHFRLTSDDGAELWLAEELVIDHDGVHAATSKIATVTLPEGSQPLEVRYFQNAGEMSLKLEWRKPGDETFALIPATQYLTPSFVTRVVAPGKKEIITPGDGTRPGKGAPLASVHPEWEVQSIRPASFQPQVGALAVHPDGRLFVATFEPNQFNSSAQPSSPNGSIWALSNTLGDNPEAVEVNEVASGLFEPAGMTFHKGELYVSQRLALTRLRDNDGDGFYESHETVSSGWDSDNYHHFHFGLITKDDYAYTTLSTSIDFNSTGLNGPNPPYRGTWLRTNLVTGAKDYLAGGLRTPNGLGFGPGGDIFQTDNQGSWLPASRLNHLRPGRFYGHYNSTARGGSPSLFAEEDPSPAAIYFPQNEIANSPTQPLLIPEGQDFAGDMLVGELTLGGIRRVSLEKVAGQWQGAVYRFTQGFEGGVNRLAWAPDGSLYVGCMGSSGNWSWNGTTHGLQRLRPREDATELFEIDRVEATPEGFRLRYTKPVPTAVLADPANFAGQHWTYAPSASYGGAKVNQRPLTITAATPAADGKSVVLTIPDRQAGYVVHLQSDLLSTEGEAIWSSEAWYTLNHIPGADIELHFASASLFENQPAGSLAGTIEAQEKDLHTPLTLSLPPGQAHNAEFTLEGNTLRTRRAFDHEVSPTLSVVIRAATPHGAFVEDTFAITIQDQQAEHSPHRLLLSNAVLPPQNEAGTRVGRLLFDDLDAGDLTPGPGVNPAGDAPVYEGFASPANLALSGLNGGSGFDGPWSSSGNGATLSSGSLSYRDRHGLSLATSGQFARSSASSRNHRPLARRWGQENEVTYLSFLAAPGSNSFFWGIELWDGAAQDSQRVLQVGNESGFGVRVRNGTNKLFPTNDNESHFYVIRIDHLPGNDEVSVWLDPPLPAEPASPDLFFNGSETGGNLSFNRLGFSDYLANSLPAVDELRIGLDWTTVTPTSSRGPLFERVSGEGDADNESFEIIADQLYTTQPLPEGLHRLRVRLTDSAGNSYQQPLVVWVGTGHLDSNNDGIRDGDAARLGSHPLDDLTPGAYFGGKEGEPALSWQGEGESFLLQSPLLPGHHYWLEWSPNLEHWQPLPESFASPEDFRSLPSTWQIRPPSEPRRFWRLAGGWPENPAATPLAHGLANLTFVGGDSQGWHYEEATGILSQRSTDPNPAEWLHFGATVDDFLLNLEFRLTTNTNSGVFLRAADSGAPWETGIEIQLTHEPREPIHATGAAYGRIPANPAVDNSADRWHRLEILLRDQHLKVTIDGVTCLDEPDLPQTYPDFSWPTSGFIGLQDSHNASGTIEFRNIRLLSF